MAWPWSPDWRIRAVLKLAKAVLRFVQPGPILEEPWVDPEWVAACWDDVNGG